jgi:hypothetical protein
MIKLRYLIKEVSVKIDQRFNAELIDKINNEYREDYTTLTPQEINDGYCDVWATLFVQKFGGKHQWSFDFPNDPSGHSWVLLNNKYYDAEKPDGVSSLEELPFFQRSMEKNGKGWLDDEFYKNIQS